MHPQTVLTRPSLVDAMPLSLAPAMPIISIRDMDTARRFYDETLGLELVADKGIVQIWQCGGGHVMLSQNPEGSKAEHCVAAWEVEDVEAAVAELRGRGVAFEDFGMPNEDGIVRFGDDRVGYFRDPDGNLLSLTQFG